MAYSSRGAALTGKGESDKAIASFDEAIRLDPKIANMPFYKRYRAVAECAMVPGPLGGRPTAHFRLVSLPRIRRVAHPAAQETRGRQGLLTSIPWAAQE